jgi:hypothetical protein
VFAFPYVGVNLAGVLRIIFRRVFLHDKERIEAVDSRARGLRIVDVCVAGGVGAAAVRRVESGELRRASARGGRSGRRAGGYSDAFVCAGRERAFAHRRDDGRRALSPDGAQAAAPRQLRFDGVIVTAESTAQPERPAGSPVLSTRAAEARALFTSDKDASDRTPGRQSAASGGGGRANRKTSKGARLLDKSPWPRSSRAGDFYSDVESALDAQGGGQLLELFGTDATPGAEGAARVAVRTGTAFARARFLSLPAPSTLGANVYVMWGVQPDGRIIYMGSLPTDLNLDVHEIYLRTAGFTADEYSLYLTAEKQRPVHQPSNVRVLETRLHVK